MVDAKTEAARHPNGIHIEYEFKFLTKTDRFVGFSRLWCWNQFHLLTSILFTDYWICAQVLAPLGWVWRSWIWLDQWGSCASQIQQHRFWYQFKLTLLVRTSATIQLQALCFVTFQLRSCDFSRMVLNLVSYSVDGADIADFVILRYVHVFPTINWLKWREDRPRMTVSLFLVHFQLNITHSRTRFQNLHAWPKNKQKKWQNAQ